MEASGDWLVSITEQCNESVKAKRGQNKPRIQRVPHLIGKNHDFSKTFEPEVVAIGPYHSRKPHLEAMEEHKKAAAARFVAGSGHPIGSFHNKAPELSYWDKFRSATELKEVGIRFKMSKSRRLRDMQFERGWVHGTLSLPPIIVDDLTRSRFLNLIALEMCPDGWSDYGITSYVWFMDRLIDLPGDVKELRSKGVLLNGLGSDEQVACLFNELGKDLAPDYQAYNFVRQGIQQHCGNKMRVSVVRMLHKHFDTPWAGIAFCAAVLLLALTVVQTYFAVWPSGNK